MPALPCCSTGSREEEERSLPAHPWAAVSPAPGSLCLQPALSMLQWGGHGWAVLDIVLLLLLPSILSMATSCLELGGGGVVGAAAAEQRAAALLPLCLVGCYFVILHRGDLS